jgi:exo-beta-1,3-glucanase (GH17 family)
MRTVNSTLGPLRRLAVLATSLTLAACGSSQNWDDDKPFVTVGGSVSGLNGTLDLWNNGGDRLTVTSNGDFEFPLQIANGSNYAVLVASQPAGQTCTVTGGSGVANGNVRNVAVNCVAYSFTRRPLPAIYTTGKAVNYSPYRTLGGPGAFEVPTDAQILEDLGLLQAGGYNLLRLFGAAPPATDVVSEKILRLAAQNYPDIKFQLGVFLGGVTSCSQTTNDKNISYLISTLSKYPNVVTISVGNETSFYSKFMPLPCLESYIRTIRSQVTQPVTTDDDWTFFAGKPVPVGDRVVVKPDTILPLIDFVAVHMYPISYTNWNWQQVGVPAGPERARAMMEESLVVAKAYFDEVAKYKYVGPGGLTVTTGDTMPIIVTETGWKARQTNPASEIEQYAARPANQKWYYDLLYGSPGRYPSWQGSAGGPSMIFYFEAFDEQWKGIDDGWGLWDIERDARYVLCGTPVGPACNPDVYAGAGYYDPPPFSTVTFDSPSVNYALVGFGGAEDSQVVADPVGGTNKVARVLRSATAESFAGTVVGTAGGLTVGAIPFDASNTRMSVRVYSPAAGIRVRLKVEDSTNAARSVETEAVTTRAGAWETLTFDFANPVAGTPALNLAFVYNRVAIFFNFGVTGATAGAQTFYFDDIAFIGGGGLPIGPFSDLSFDSSGVVYTLTGFGGAEDSSLQPDPTNAANTAVRVNRSATAETFAGTVVSTGPNLTAGTIPFTATDTRMSVRVYSPAAGIRVRLKVEDAANPSRSVETEAVTTRASAWETLTFDFANPVSGTPALNPSYNYNRVIIFFNFGVAGATAGAQTFYFDDVKFLTGGASGSTGTCAAPSCTDFSAAGITFGVFENPGGGTVEVAKDPNDSANDVVKFVKKTGDNDYFGTTISGLAGPATLTTASKTVTMRVYSPAAGTNFLLKLEGGPGGAVVEKDMVTTLAGAWETLSFDLSAGAVGTYATVVVFPNGRSKVTADTTMYIDELRFPASSGGGSATPIIFASGYATANRTVEGGEWGFYSGDFTSYANTYAGGGFVDGAGAVPAADSYVYLVVTTSAPTTGGYMGIFTAAPGSTIAAPNAGVTLSGHTSLKLELGVAAEWFAQPTNKQVTVRLIGSQVYSNGSGGNCRILIDKLVTPTTADLVTYTVELGSMTLAQGCNGGGFTSGVTTLAEALAKPIGEVHVQAVFPQLNTTVKNGAGTEYPTGFTRGSVTFE